MQFITDTCRRLKLANSQTKRLMTYHHKHKKSALETYLSPKHVSYRKLNAYNYQAKNKLVSCVQKCLEFLSTEESLLEVMLVSKRWLKELKMPVFRRFLID